MVWLLLLMIAPGAAAVPPPVQQRTADCSAPVYASDQLVCSDPALRALDARLASALAISPAPAAAGWVEGDNEWFRRRSLCAFQQAHRECLSEAYTDRLEVLEQRMLPPAAGTLAACRGEGYTGTLRIIGDPGAGRRVLVDPVSGEVVGVAAARHRFQAWAPALVFEPHEGGTDFTRHAGAGFVCRPMAD